MDTDLYKFKLLNCLKKQMHIDYHNQLKHMFVSSYIDGTMYTIWSCIIFIFKIIFFLWGKLFLSLVFLIFTVMKWGFLKMLLHFFLYVNCIVQPAFWPFLLLLWITLRQMSTGTKHSQFSLWEICWHLNWLLLEFVFGWSLHDLWNPGIWPTSGLDSVALSLAASGSLSSQSWIFWTSPSLLTLWKPNYEELVFSGPLSQPFTLGKISYVKQNTTHHFLVVVMSPVYVPVLKVMLTEGKPWVKLENARYWETFGIV